MFGQTWRWAGKFRQTNKNIGVDWEVITQRLKNLVDDVEYQTKKRSYVFDELATRFHHRLVAIHPFPNGNGRHARLMTDILLTHHNQERFSWRRKDLYQEGNVREQYINALRKADRNDYSELFDFVRS